jgi:hypothetical protein
VQGLSVFVREEGACVDAVEGGFNDGSHNPAPLELGLLVRLPSPTPPDAMVARARPAACAALAAEDAIVCLMYRHSPHCGARAGRLPRLPLSNLHCVCVSVWASSCCVVL